MVKRSKSQNQLKRERGSGAQARILISEFYTSQALQCYISMSIFYILTDTDLVKLLKNRIKILTISPNNKLNIENI